MVAWQDGASQSSSPTRSPSKGGYSPGKGSGGRCCGKGKNVAGYAPIGLLTREIRRHVLRSALVCLRCGMEGHWAAHCNQPPKSAAVKRPALVKVRL